MLKRRRSKSKQRVVALCRENGWELYEQEGWYDWTVTIINPKFDSIVADKSATRLNSCYGAILSSLEYVNWVSTHPINKVKL